ncbi:MAG: class I SAM-dependent RNA methyltransferase [Gemmatimonadales bacterium]
MIATVDIERIAAGGDGVGRMGDGLVVFVPRTAPGDRAEIELSAKKRNFARARLVGLDSQGPDRVEPQCAHYRTDKCGGCQLQHLSTAAQLSAKSALVGDALRRIGRREVADPAIVAPSHPWRYRSKISLSVSDRRIGLHVYDRPGQVFDLEDCLIVRQRIMNLWGELKKRKGFFPAGMSSLVLREDREGGLHVICTGGETVWNGRDLAEELRDAGVSVWRKPERGAARVVAGRKTGFPAVAFEQVNLELACRVCEEAVEGLGNVAGRVVWDLYAGVGDASELLACAGADVWCVDADRSAVEWGRKRFGGSGTERGSVKRLCGRVEDTLCRLPEADAIVVNPPRAGLHESVSHDLDGWGAGRSGRRLAYVSCDPATLGRDLRRMPALGIRTVTAYDLFPQTSHVETLVVLESG